MVDYTQRMAVALGVKGLMNVQYVIMRPEGWSGDGTGPGSEVYVIEVNPRASRTVPFISKVTGVPMVRLAVQVMLGKTLRELGWEPGLWPDQNLVAVKAPVFSMSKLIGVDTHLGPEMKSTGEVMGIDTTFEAALAKALQAADMALPKTGSILLSLADHTKTEAIPLIRALVDAGYKIYATEGTAATISAIGLPVEQVPKRLDQGYPNVVDVIREGLVNAVINTPEGRITETLRDGFHIRRAAAEKRIPCLTSIDTAAAAVHALVAQDPHFTIQPSATTSASEARTRDSRLAGRSLRGHLPHVALLPARRARRDTRPLPHGAPRRIARPAPCPPDELSPLPASNSCPERSRRVQPPISNLPPARLRHPLRRTRPRHHPPLT
jgi:carbamoyl-phosphate synthase large subunit